MAQPAGSLTGTQLEIMEAIWAAGKEGRTVAEIWQQLSGSRKLARTTVLTMVVRLEARGWLHRKGDTNGYRYFATRGKNQATGRIAVRFVDEFFGGSATELVMSLLGTKKIKPQEVENLRRLLNEADKNRRADDEPKP